MTPSSLTVRPAADPSDLRRIHALDADTFGGEAPYFPLATYMEFWAAAADMFWVVEVDGTVVGSAAFAPFSLEWVAAYQRGEASERDATAADIEPARPAHHWYFGSLVIRPAFRGRGFGTAAFSRILRQQLNSGQFAFPLGVLGSAYSVGGASLIQGLGGERIGSAAAMPDGLDAYHARFDSGAELDRALGSARPAHKSLR